MSNDKVEISADLVKQIYKMADVSYDWVKEFWGRLLENS